MTAGFDIPDISAVISREISKGESDNLEFKISKPSKDAKYVKTAIAFANGSGGRILFGVDDRGDVSGIPDDEVFKTRDSITQALNDSIEPQISFDVCIVNIEGKNVIVAEFVPGKNTPYHLKGRDIDAGTYVRINAITVPADSGTIRSLMANGENMYFDSLEQNSMEVTEKESERLCHRIFGMNAEISSLINAGILINVPHGYKATRAYALLTENPFPYAAVHCIRFHGNDAIFVDESRDLTDDLFDQIDGATDFIANRIFRYFEMDDRQLHRIDRYEIPLIAFREAVVNAVLHRDYFLDSFSIFVRVFDDRVEIESPGTPYKLSLEQTLSGYSSIRNPILMSVFKRRGYVEGYGTGIRKMIRACEENGSFEPRFEIDHQHFKVTFPRGKKVPDEILEEDENAVMELIKSDGGITQTAISERTGIELSKVKRITLALQQKKLIMRSGSRRSGCWLLNPEISYGPRR